MALFSFLYLYGIHPEFWIAPARPAVAYPNRRRLCRGGRPGAARAPSARPKEIDALEPGDADFLRPAAPWPLAFAIDLWSRAVWIPN